VAWWALLVAQTNDSERQGTVYRGCIRRDHPAIAGHFPGYPIVPGALLLTELLHALESTVGQNGRVLELSSVKFIAPLHPDEPFTIYLDRVDATRLKFQATCHDRIIASGVIRHTCL